LNCSFFCSSSFVFFFPKNSASPFARWLFCCPRFERSAPRSSSFFCLIILRHFLPGHVGAPPPPPPPPNERCPFSHFVSLGLPAGVFRLPTERKSGFFLETSASLVYEELEKGLVVPPKSFSLFLILLPFCFFLQLSCLLRYPHPPSTWFFSFAHSPSSGFHAPRLLPPFRRCNPIASGLPRAPCRLWPGSIGAPRPPPFSPPGVL